MPRTSLQYASKTLQNDKEIVLEAIKEDHRALKCASDELKNNNVDGAFLDINMPNISGIELAKKILDISKKIKICFITGINVTVDNLNESIKNNVLGIIYKPVSVLKLEHFISRMRNESSLIEVKTFGTCIRLCEICYVLVI